MAEFKKDAVISNMMNVQLALNLLFEVFEGKDSKFYHYLRKGNSDQNYDRIFLTIFLLDLF